MVWLVSLCDWLTDWMTPSSSDLRRVPSPGLRLRRWSSFDQEGGDCESRRDGWLELYKRVGGFYRANKEAP